CSSGQARPWWESHPAPAPSRRLDWRRRRPRDPGRSRSPGPSRRSLRSKRTIRRPCRRRSQQGPPGRVPCPSLPRSRIIRRGDGLIELHGKAAAIEACRASGEAITAIGEWCADHGVDAWYRKSGFLEVATSETHERVLQRGAALAAEAGVGEEYTWLSAEQVRG